MPRLPEVASRDALPEDKRHAYDYLAETRGSVRVPFSILLNSPEATARIAAVGTYVRFESTLPKPVTELATLAAAREFDCKHEWQAHARLAREAGVSEDAIQAIGHRKALDGLSDEEALPIEYARQILQKHTLTEATFDAARQRYGDTGVLDLTATVGYYAMLACMINAVDIVPPPTAEPLP
jgi:4-carboxymuconolactone decarboxylase